MTQEIFYLESCLAIEKSMVEISEACAEGLGSIDEGFLFESPRDVFSTLREKIKKLIEKVKNIFSGKASKAQEQAVAKKAEKLGDVTIEVQDAGKVKKLYDKATNDIKSGKDPDKVNAWFKKGLVALGVLTVAGSAAAIGVTKHKKKIKANQAQKQVQDINKAIIQGGAELEKNSAITLRYGEKILQKAVNGTKPVENTNKETAPNVLRQVNGYSELYSNYSKAMNSCRMSVVGSLKATPTVSKDAITKGMNRYVNAHKSNKAHGAYRTEGDWGDGADGLNESYEYDSFDDDDIFAESFDEDELFDDVHTI